MPISSCDGRKRSIEGGAQFLRASGDKIMIMVESYDKPDKQGTARSTTTGSESRVQRTYGVGHGHYVRVGVHAVQGGGTECAPRTADRTGECLWSRVHSDSEAQALERLLATRDNRDLRLLRAVLAVGGFELVGALSDHGTDTQGFVTVRRAGDEMDMAMVSFRGTENVQDWITNLQYSLTPADSPQAEGRESTGKVHRGFL